jgi:UDP-GlcNAc:undecaprenyl-phosphate/decaprenyl-phosphate GlcNAc-1-phosphate transferase
MREGPVQLLLAFVVALSTTTALIPLLVRWAPAMGLTDRPGPRKVHRVPVPRVGGLAMAVGVLVPALLSVPLIPAVRGVLLGLLILLFFGLWDDRAPLGYRMKFLGQVLAVAACMAVGRVQIGDVTIGGVDLLRGPVAMLVTFFFLIGVTNAVNLSDGLDGLAGGMVLLCLCAVALFAAAAGKPNVTALCLIEGGAVLGFLRFNTHPARIFMGDSGSQVLGFSVGALALLATQGENSTVSPALPLLLLGLPILDTLTAMVRRIRAGQSPFAADSNHLHHRLLALGFTHREAVATVYLLQVALVLLAYFLRFESDGEVIATFCAFSSLVLALLGWSSHAGWRLHEPQRTALLRLHMRGIISSPRIPQLALAVMTTCLGVYAATVVAMSTHVTPDVGVLSATMLIALLLLSVWRTERLPWIERAVAYVSVVLLVYLDQTTHHKTPFITTASWTLIAITGAAAVTRFWLSPTRRFEVTALDLLVVFIALVVPNLPGSFALPPDLPSGIAKAVILLYVVEMLLTINFKLMTPRVFLALTLAVIAGRALAGAGF